MAVGAGLLELDSVVLVIWGPDEAPRLSNVVVWVVDESTSLLDPV